MVFEADLQTVKDDVSTDQYLKGSVDLDSLITKIETHYATLNPRQKRDWEDTRLELAHSKEHLQECLNNRSIIEQRSRIQRILNGIPVI